LGTARWWVSASRLTGGTEAIIITETINKVNKPMDTPLRQPENLKQQSFAVADTGNVPDFSTLALMLCLLTCIFFNQIMIGCADKHNGCKHGPKPHPGLRRFSNLMQGVNNIAGTEIRYGIPPV
jgi:hypothetical protein